MDKFKDNKINKSTSAFNSKDDSDTAVFDQKEPAKHSTEDIAEVIKPSASQHERGTLPVSLEKGNDPLVTNPTTSSPNSLL